MAWLALHVAVNGLANRDKLVSRWPGERDRQPRSVGTLSQVTADIGGEEFIVLMPATGGHASSA